MSEYIKLPVVINAEQTPCRVEIETLEGTMMAVAGDWIITGVNGERYPCKPDIFEKTYMPAPSPEARQRALAMLRGEYNCGGCKQHHRSQCMRFLYFATPDFSPRTGDCWTPREGRE